MQTLDREHFHQLSKCTANQIRELWAQLEARQIMEMLRHIKKRGHRSRGSWNENIGGLKDMFMHSKRRRLTIQIPKHFHTHGIDEEAADDLSESDESSSMHAYPASLPASPEQPPPASHVTPNFEGKSRPLPACSCSENLSQPLPACNSSCSESTSQPCARRRKNVLLNGASA